MTEASILQCNDFQAYVADITHGSSRAFGVWLQAKGGVYRPGREEESVVAYNHYLSCDICKAWVHNQIPEDFWVRQRRMSYYCCPSMFVATEESDPIDSVQFTFALIRDEPCWLIEGKQVYARFCPWCGGSLPSAPFIKQNEV